jgi:hypothetical protein
MPVHKFFLDDRSPFTLDFRVDVAATLPRIAIQILDDGAAVPLTAPVVTFTMTDEDGNIKINDQPGVVIDAATGQVGYDLQTADVDVEDIFFGQFKIVVSSGGIYKIPNDADQKLRILIGNVDPLA